MPYRRNYPRSVTEVLDDRATYKPDCLRAVKAFRRRKAWRGIVPERMEKFGELQRALAAVYGLPVPKLTFVPDARPNGCYVPSDHEIVLFGRLSVVTFLHEFAHARGFDERQACRWSINLFRRLFPRSFARCTFRGHMLVCANPRART